MSEFKINTENLRICSDLFEKVQTSVNACENKIMDIAESTDGTSGLTDVVLKLKEINMELSI